MKTFFNNSCELPSRKVILTFALAAVSVAPAFAQQPQNSQYNPRFGMGHLPDATVVHSANVDSNPLAAEEKCFPWKLPEGRATTVGVQSLNVPSKARKDYDKACEATKKGKYDEAEQFARGAIEKYDKYTAAWILLGASLNEEQKPQDALDACAHAATLDNAYMPAYLCTAEVSNRKQDWKQTLSAANAVLRLNAGGELYAFFYRASAYLHMNNLEEAEKSALQAVQIDANHDEPSISLLLAKIYERKGDNEKAIAQLQQLLKRHPDRQTAEEAKQSLATLESQQPAK